MTYRRRKGRSKISGTLRGVVGAGFTILGLLLWYGLFARGAVVSRISVVIPTLDEERRIGRRLDELRALAGNGDSRPTPRSVA